MYTYEIKRKVDAPATVVWDVISDVERYAEYAPNLSKAKIVNGSRIGLQRQCWDTQGRDWNEECVLWNGGHMYSIRVNTSDYPYPFTHIQGTWGLEEEADGTWVIMKFEYQPEFDPPVIGWGINKVLQNRAFRPTCKKLMDNWEAEISKQR